MSKADPAATGAMQSCRVDLWLVPLEQPAPAADHALLDRVEQQRAARFVFERDRRRFIVAHAALRRILAGYLECAPETLRFAAADGAKPRLLAGAGDAAACLAWNLSHSGELALVGVVAESRTPDPAGTLELGVDIECLRPLSDAPALAARHFTPAECAALAAQPAGEARDRAFLACWTRKEACLKAVGAGLAIDTRSFECGLDDDAGVNALALQWNGIVRRLVVRSADCAPGALVAVALAANHPRPIEVRLRTPPPDA